MGAPTLRLYVDEVGNHDLDKDQVKPAERYLSLTGVILDLAYTRDVVAPALDALKARHFSSHPDDPVVLHRRDIVRKEKAFTVLRDPERCAAFDTDLMGLLAAWDYTVITVTIDKWRAYEKYGEETKHPYHYCMDALVERFVLELRARKTTGDVMAEVRGANEDRLLRASFASAHARGTPVLGSTRFQSSLSSHELKLKQKNANVPGLQIADALAAPAYRVARARRDQGQLPDSMTGRLGALLLESKFRRSREGTIRGYGLKWLP